MYNLFTTFYLQTYFIFRHITQTYYITLVSPFIMFHSHSTLLPNNNLIILLSATDRNLIFDPL